MRSRGTTPFARGGSERTTLDGIRVLRAIKDHDLALHAMLRRDSLGDRLQRVNIPPATPDDLADFRRNRGNLDHHSPFTRDSYHFHELRSIHQRHDNPLDEFQDGSLRCILLCTQRAFLPCEIPDAHRDKGDDGRLLIDPYSGLLRLAPAGHRAADLHGVRPEAGSRGDPRSLRPSDTESDYHPRKRKCKPSGRRLAI